MGVRGGNTSLIKRRWKWQGVILCNKSFIAKALVRQKNTGNISKIIPPADNDKAKEFWMEIIKDCVRKNRSQVVVLGEW